MDRPRMSPICGTDVGNGIGEQWLVVAGIRCFELRANLGVNIGATFRLPVCSHGAKRIKYDEVLLCDEIHDGPDPLVLAPLCGVVIICSMPSMES